MVQVQVELPEEQLQRLQALAAKRDVSVSELVLQGVEHVLHEAPATDKAVHQARALAAMGRFHSGYSDISTRHDDYLAEDLAYSGDQ